VFVTGKPFWWKIPETEIYIIQGPGKVAIVPQAYEYLMLKVLLALKRKLSALPHSTSIKARSH
jgi:hypothetical protein